MSEDSSTSDLGEVFISYSWDNEEHVRAVLALSDRLRSDGIDCVLDQYEVSPPEGWPRWMDRRIESASLVIVVCTETYFNRVVGKEAPDKGKGVKWEGSIIYQHLYNQGAENRKFVPVLMKAVDQRFIPVPLQGASHFVVDSDAGYKKLYNRLLGRPPAERPPLGKRRPMPKRDVKTDLIPYIETPIDIPLWDQAQWRGTSFARLPGMPPILGLAFLNRGPAEKIFQRWRRRYGASDQFEELRVAIIEGPVLGEDPGYTVHISLDFENAFKRYRAAGFEMQEPRFFTSISRLNRMNPKPGSAYLSMFKESVQEHGEYLLVPASINPDGSNLEIAPHLGIRKKVLYFRNTSEISEQDIDSIVLHSGSKVRPLTKYGESRKRDTVE